jgi:hypothetical protein
MINIAASCDIITRAGAYYSYDGQRWQGKDAMILGFREDIGMQEKLRTEVLTHFNVPVV